MSVTATSTTRSPNGDPTSDHDRARRAAGDLRIGVVEAQLVQWHQDIGSDQPSGRPSASVTGSPAATWQRVRCRLASSRWRCCLVNRWRSTSSNSREPRRATSGRKIPAAPNRAGLANIRRDSRNRPARSTRRCAATVPGNCCTPDRSSVSAATVPTSRNSRSNPGRSFSNTTFQIARGDNPSRLTTTRSRARP